MQGVEERGLRRMEQYATSVSRASRSKERSDRRERRPSTLLRTVACRTACRMADDALMVIRVYISVLTNVSV